MDCPNCGVENPEGMKFCEECGTKLVRACPRCGQQVRPSAKFCGECGTTLKAERKHVPATVHARTRGQSPGLPSHPAARSTSARPQAPTPEADRRQLTVEFIDLVGSTTLSQQLDPEDYHARVVAYQTACRQVVERYEG